MKFSAAIKKLSSFTMCCSLVYLSLDSASAAIFTVNSTADTNTGVGNSGTLRFCLNQYGSGDTINFDPTVFPSSTATAITLTSQLPIVRLPVTIAGNAQTNGSPAVAISGAGAFEGFYIVSGGSVSISNIHITNALALGGTGGQCANGGAGGGGVGAGGGIYVDQTATGVTIQNMVLNSNTAQGGGGGILNGGGSGGSGGGGLNGGNGAQAHFTVGGGGGGGDPGGISATTNGNGLGGAAGPQGGGGGVAGAAGGSPGTTVGTAAGGGGAGGGDGVVGSNGNNGAGVNGGTGGAGGSGTGGGGGGGASTGAGGIGGNGGVGGFGGGSGGGGIGSVGEGSGAAGGFGAGGGGGARVFGTGGAGGAGGGGSGANGNAGFPGSGGGGSGFGGAIFVRRSGVLTIQDGSISSNSAIAGAGGTDSGGLGTPGSPGSAFGPDIYMMSGSSITFNVSSSLSITSAIASDQGAGGGTGGGITKTGAGTLTFSGANTYTGGTTFLNGILSISSAGNLGGTSDPLTFNGGTLQATSSLSLSQNVTLTGAGTFDVTPSSTNMTLSGTISGGGSLTKTSAGTLTLSGANNYTGVTNFNGGTISVAAANNLGNSSSFSFNGGTLQATGTMALTQNISLIGAGTFDTPGTTLTLSGAITGAGSLTKTSSGTVQLSGVSNTYSGATTVSGGTLQAGAANAFSPNSDVTLGAGTTLNLNNFSQTIASLASASSSSSVTMGSGMLTTGDAANTTFAGTISGTGGLTKQGSGTFTLSGANTYSGTTTFSAGTISISASNNLGNSMSFIFSGGTLQTTSTMALSQTMSMNTTGTLDVASGTSLTLFASGGMSGAGSMTKTGGGTLFMSGTNTYSGGTTIAAGTLNLNGSTGGGMVINSGGLLSGNATIGGASTNNGTMSPGNNSIGTINVMGNFIQGPGGLLDIEINSAGASSLVAVSGTAFLNGTVQFFPDPGTYVDGTIYTFLTAGDGINGTFSRAILLGGLMFTPTLIYSATEVQMVLTPFRTFTSFNFGGNSGAVAAYLDCLNVTNGLSDIGIVITALLGLDPNALNCALFQLQPSMFGAYSVVEEESMIQVRSAISRRTNELHSSGCSYPELQGHRVSLWIDGFGGFMGQHRFHQSKFHTHNGGGAVGLDVGFGHYGYIGAMGSYNDTHIKWDDHCANGTGKDRSWYGGIYATWFNKYAFVDISGIGAKNRYKGERKIQFGTINRTAKHHHDGHEVSANLSAGGNIHIVKNFMIQPFARGDYIFLHQDHIEETNAGSINLFVASKNDKMIRSEGGLNFCFCQDFGTTDLAITPTISYVRESRFGNRHYETEFKQFKNTNCSFIVETGKPDRHIVAPALTISSQSYDNRLAFSLNYSGEFGRHFSESEFSARIDGRF